MSLAWVAGLQDTYTILLGSNLQNLFHHLCMHSCPWRIGNNHIGMTIFPDKAVCKNIFHIPCKKPGIFDVVDLRIHLCIFNGLGNRINAHNSIVPV